MIRNLRELSEKVTELTNYFAAIAVARAHDGQVPAYISLFEAAPEGFPIHLMEHLTTMIQGELMARPEIRSIQLLSVQEATKVNVPGRLIAAVECEPEYLIDKPPETFLSMARMAEVGERAIEYVYEESEDVVQDLTERLGMSLHEVSVLDPSYSFVALSANPSEHTSEPLTDKIQDAHLRVVPQISEGPSHSEPAFE